MTQENLRAPGYQERQTPICLNGETIWVDRELAPLLIELNKVGLVTRSHCSGHGLAPAFVVIRSASIVRVEVRMDGEYQELALFWNMPGTVPSQLEQLKRRYGIAGIYDEFTSLEDAFGQMAMFIKEREAEWNANGKEPESKNALFLDAL